MSSHLFAAGNRRRPTTTLAAILSAAVLISAAPPPAHATSGRTAPVLAQGTGMGDPPSALVRAVQLQLHRRGYDLGPTGVDGRFGPRTDAAVRRMQADRGLAVDGVVGDHTLRALRVPSRTVPQPRLARSHARPRAETVRVNNGASAPHPVALRVPDRSTSTNRVGVGGRTEPTIAAGFLGGFGGAIAAMALGLERSRRRRGESTIRFPEPVVAANVAPPDHDESPDAWTVHLPGHDDTAAPVLRAAEEAGLSPSRLPSGRAVIGYITVSDAGSSETVRSSAAIQATCERSNWNLLEIIGDRENGRVLERPGLGYALERIAEGHACGLVVSDLQRLSRSIVDLGALMRWFRDANATLIALDLGIDTSTPEGDCVATTLIALSARAHERIAARTRSRLAKRRADGDSNGRPAVRDRPDLMERIATMRDEGMTLQAIADQLNSENVPTLRGGKKWRPSSIQAPLGYRRPGPRDHLPRLTRERP
jgi:DNA invertase Pin-like site-specific DNA recombinase